MHENVSALGELIKSIHLIKTHSILARHNFRVCN